MNELNYNKNLFQKFLENRLNKKEFKKFMEWMDKDNIERPLKLLIDQYLESENGALFSAQKESQDSSEMVFQKIIAQIEDEKNATQKQKKESAKKKYAAVYAMAACLIIVLGFVFTKPQFTSSVILQEHIDPNAITLTLENGNVEVITENGTKKITDQQGNVVGEQYGNILNYLSKKNTQKLAYNTLNVPYGKRFDVVLSDGTKVKLNAGSSIKYPVTFMKGSERKVFVQGEAFFEVSKDEHHPFVVNLNDLNIKVLGTQFNVSFYPEDNEINTVLVEGAVALYDGIEMTKPLTLLAPGQKAEWNKSKKQIQVNEVNTEIYTAWKEGVLTFKNTSFLIIRQKLERHFNVRIQNEFEALDVQQYTASFSSGESIENILDYFKVDTPFSTSLENGIIILSKPNH